MDNKSNYKYLLSDLTALKGVGVKTTNLLKKKKINNILNYSKINIIPNNKRAICDINKIVLPTVVIRAITPQLLIKRIVIKGK